MDTPSQPGRLLALDWLRGGAVMVMVQCHALVLLGSEYRHGALYKLVCWLDGFVAPSFLFAAGGALGLVLVRAAAQRRLLARVRQSAWRTGEVLLASVLMTSIWFPILREPKWLLRVDILSCIGLSLLAALPLGALLARQPARLANAALAGAVLVAFGAPLLEQVQGVPAAFLGNTTGSMFPPVPWGAHVLFGLAVGAGAGPDFGRHVRRLLMVATGLWLFALLVRPLYPPHGPYSEPAGHAERFAEVTALTWALHWLSRRAAKQPGPLRWVVELFGRRSLAAYCGHEILLYVPVLGFCFRDRFGETASWVRYAPMAAALLGLTFALCVALDALGRLRDFTIQLLPGRTPRSPAGS